MRRSLSGVVISWRSIVADMVKEIAAIAGNSIFIAYRTPDRERGSDYCLRVKRSWKVQLKAGQGFGGLVCSGYLSFTLPIMFVFAREPQKRLSFA